MLISLDFSLLSLFQLSELLFLWYLIDKKSFSGKYFRIAVWHITHIWLFEFRKKKSEMKSKIENIKLFCKGNIPILHLIMLIYTLHFIFIIIYDIFGSQNFELTVNMIKPLFLKFIYRFPNKKIWRVTEYFWVWLQHSWKILVYIYLKSEEFNL